MATGKKAGNDRYEQPAWKGFLDCPLDAQQLEQCDDWNPEPSEIWELVGALSVEGYTFKLSFSPKLKAATATMVDSIPGSKQAGYALSARDANCALALKMLLYKHASVLEGTWEYLAASTAPAKRG